MKKAIYIFLIAIMTMVSFSTFSSCREDKKTPGEKIESGLDEAGDAADEAGDKIENAADKVGDKVEDATDN